MLLAENLVKWSAADKVCTDMFSGSHLATEILKGAPDYNLIAMENFQSVWLNSKAFNLGCKGNRFFIKWEVAFSYIYYYLICTSISNQYVVEVYNIKNYF